MGNTYKKDLKNMITILTIIFLLLFLVSFLLYLHGRADIWETLCITFGVTLYHFLMRISVGCVFNKILHNNVDYTRKWFQEKFFEKALYKIIRVKKWKQYMPTYNLDHFNIQNHSLIEIVEAGCQAELVHETIVLLSFLPIILIIWFDAGVVFVLTSFMAAMLDGALVILQRYNRPRLLRLIR